MPKTIETMVHFDYSYPDLVTCWVFRSVVQSLQVKYCLWSTDRLANQSFKIYEFRMSSLCIIMNTPCNLLQAWQFFLNSTIVQGRVVYGELLLSMKQVGGRIEQQSKIWILLSELVLGAGNSFILVIFRYLILLMWFCIVWYIIYFITT